MRLGFFLREALRAMRRNAAPTFAALATVLVTMLVLGVFIPAVEVTNSAADTVQSRLAVDVYMKTDANAAQEARVKRELLALAHVKQVIFVSKAQALKQQRSTGSGGVRAARREPAARHLPGDPGQSGERAGGPQRADAAHAERRHDDDRLVDPEHLEPQGRHEEGARADRRREDGGGLAFSLLLVLASILLIGNTIRLSLYARRREVEVMKLVGATDWFIRWPFVIEGIIVGAAGAVLAVAALGIAKVALLDPLASGWTLVAATRTIAFPALLAVLLAAGIGVSALGSGMSLRRFLRV